MAPMLLGDLDVGKPLSRVGRAKTAVCYEQPVATGLSLVSVVSQSSKYWACTKAAISRVQTACSQKQAAATVHAGLTPCLVG